MKFLYKILLAATLFVSVTACDVTELDLLENPNAVTPENASLNDLYNNVQLTFRDAFNSTWGPAGGLTRMTALTPFSVYDYRNTFQPTAFDGIWTTVYAGLIPDIDALVALAEERELDIHAGSAKIMKAYSLMMMVDMFGNIPYSEAFKGTDIISPVVDPGQQVYAAAEVLLDEAIGQMTGTTAAGPTGDIFYAGAAAKWITLAKTLKLRTAVTTRLADSGAAAKINALLAEGDLIDMASEDFQFNYGNTRANPNSRHPFYNNAYENTDATYLGNYFMWLLIADKVDENDEPVSDPRLRFYFYRQTATSDDLDKNVYGCHFSDLPDQDQKPVHYNDVDPRIPYCIAATNGYYGRDHINGEGIPPDGDIRTVYGLYPGGGQFDDNTYQDTQRGGTTGGFGQGIVPILLSSFVDFLRAEAALTIKTNDDPRALLESGIRKSIEKVISFKSLVPATMSRQITNPVSGETNTVEELFVPSDEQIQEYIDFVLAQYDAAPDEDKKLDIIMKEYYIALWGNGLDSYNNYRRTGKPDNMAPTLEPNPGEFIRSVFYPSVFVNRNAKAEQKSLTDPVFWDTNPAGFVY